MNDVHDKDVVGERERIRPFSPFDMNRLYGSLPNVGLTSCSPEWTNRKANIYLNKVIGQASAIQYTPRNTLKNISWEMHEKIPT